MFAVGWFDFFTCSALFCADVMLRRDMMIQSAQRFRICCCDDDNSDDSIVLVKLCRLQGGVGDG